MQLRERRGQKTRKQNRGGGRAGDACGRDERTAEAPGVAAKRRRAYARIYNLCSFSLSACRSLPLEPPARPAKPSPGRQEGHRPGRASTVAPLGRRTEVRVNIVLNLAASGELEVPIRNGSLLTHPN